jgi:hypothetical protein
MKTKEKDIVYGRKYVRFIRGGKAHNLLSKGICCYKHFALHLIENYKGSIFDPDEELKIGIDTVYDLRKTALDKLYSMLSDLDDAVGMSLMLYHTEFGTDDTSLKLSRWCERYNEVAKEFSRVHKTKVKVFRPWWNGV